MDKYQTTNTWKKTLGKECAENQQAINRLKDTFISFRGNVSHLAGEISRSLPEYTVHDITHIDALWEMADCICGDNYEINPVEGFILGGAFLLHDLAMSLAAYPGGISELEKMQIWNDTVVQRYNTLGASLPASTNYTDLSSDCREYVVSTVLRKLHASSAEKLATIAWADNSTNDLIFLIENPEIRQTFGKLIGKVAHSHWWNISRLEEEFSRTIGAPSWCPREWTVDPLKIACILRVSDASHIDSRRAPQFLRTLRKLSPLSDNHWRFQEKIQKPYLSDDCVFYTSGYSFKASEASSWWLAYEALKMIDKELRQTDALLADRTMERFQAKRVFGIESPERLSSLIQTEDWSPIDAFVHIGDLPKIIKNLGGEELYGKDLTVPIRELIQNASDAIRARRKLENRSDDWGCIKIRKWSENDNHFIQVEDNGIGMSLNVVKNYLFDFGSSYWGSELMIEEHPGLMAKDIKVTGKYGIGFFSAFMLGNNIQISTRKCTGAQNETHVIEFKNGLNSRPITRKASQEEFLIDGGTQIKIQFESKLVAERVFKRIDGESITLENICISIAPSLDTDIVTIEDTIEKSIPANYWKKCPSNDFIKLLQMISHRNSFDEEQPTAEELQTAAENLREIIDTNGEVVGRAFLGSTFMGHEKGITSIGGCITVGGLVENSTSGICGIVLGKNNNAARNDTTIIASESAVKAWVSEQADIVDKLYSPKELISIAQLIRILKGSPKKIPIAIYNEEHMNVEQLKGALKHKTKLILVDDFFIQFRAGDFDALICDPDVLFTCVSGVPAIIHKNGERGWGGGDNENWAFNLTNTGYICEILSEVWKIPVSNFTDIIKDFKNMEKIEVGSNHSNPIMERAFVFEKEKLTASLNS